MNQALICLYWVWVTGVILLGCEFSAGIEAASVVHRMAQVGQQSIGRKNSADENVGILTNCPDSKSNSSVRLEWTPRIIRYETPITVTADIIFDKELPAEFTEGTRTWIKGIEVPIYEYTRTQKCVYVESVFRKYFAIFQTPPCPVPAGQNFKAKNVVTVDQETPIISGDFVIRYWALNEKGEEIFCVQGEISSSESD